jgi:GNAT superfamily N-acetyltransferase
MSRHAHEGSPVAVVPVRTTAEIEAVRALFREYAASLPVDLEYQAFSTELARLPGAYRPPHGELFIARVGDLDAGCIALRRIDERVCEMKRLYVRPLHRGTGLGAILVDAVIETARGLGYAHMWLDTLPGMAAAHALYASRGFRDIPGYGGPAAAGTRYYGLRLHAT